MTSDSRPMGNGKRLLIGSRESGPGFNVSLLLSVYSAREFLRRLSFTTSIYTGRDDISNKIAIL